MGNSSLYFLDWWGLDKHHLFPKQIKEALKIKCPNLDINDFTIKLDRWGKGGNHTGIHFPNGREKYNEKMQQFIDGEISCCDFLNAAFSYIEESIEYLNQNYPSIGENPPVCPYTKPGDGLTLKDIKDDLLRQFCNGGLPTSSPMPSLVKVWEPDYELVGIAAKVNDAITDIAPVIVTGAVVVTVGIVAIGIASSVGTLGVTSVLVGIVAVVGTWLW